MSMGSSTLTTTNLMRKKPKLLLSGKILTHSGADRTHVQQIKNLELISIVTTGFLTEICMWKKILVIRVSLVNSRSQSLRLERFVTLSSSWCHSSNLSSTFTLLATFGRSLSVLCQLTWWKRQILFKNPFLMKSWPKPPNLKDLEQVGQSTCSTTRHQATAQTGSWQRQVFLQLHLSWVWLI